MSALGTARTPMRKYVPGLVWYRAFEPFGYAFIRAGVGAVLVPHGLARFGGFLAELGPYAALLPASALGAAEIAGGVMLALGLLTRPIALLFALEWLAIAASMPLKPGASWFMLGATEHYPALIVGLCIAFLLRGGGRYSLDRAIGKEV